MKYLVAVDSSYTSVGIMERIPNDEEDYIHNVETIDENCDVILRVYEASSEAEAFLMANKEWDYPTEMMKSYILS